jgi:opacity protein-like surface antigen
VRLHRTTARNTAASCTEYLKFFPGDGMLKNLTLGSLAFVLSLAQFAHAQAAPTATAKTNIQVGAGFTYARTDYGQKGDKGITGFADYDIGLHWGIEGDIHYASISTPNGVSENSYLIGPRYIYRYHRFKLYGKGLIGAGHLEIPLAPNISRSETDFVFAGGGGLEYLAPRHITIRAVDFEYQHWDYSDGLTPAVLTFGVAYRFH